ncbi:MAG: hypothetical protein M5R36_28830 [Deltaproteobacteria bacterium]|nr:hypothetical protein [Deltaproteobacteria bacterium]
MPKSKIAIPDIADVVAGCEKVTVEMHIYQGHLLARAFFDDSRELFESRGKKTMSVRKLARYLMTNHGISRSPSAIRQILAAHFQEPDLLLTEDEALRLSFRHRVDLLRVPAADKPPGLAAYSPKS